MSKRLKAGSRMSEPALETVRRWRAFPLYAVCLIVLTALLGLGIVARPLF